MAFQTREVSRAFEKRGPEHFITALAKMLVKPILRQIARLVPSLCSRYNRESKSKRSHVKYITFPCIPPRSWLHQLFRLTVHFYLCIIKIQCALVCSNVRYRFLCTDTKLVYVVRQYSRKKKTQLTLFSHLFSWKDQSDSSGPLLQLLMREQFCGLTLWIPNFRQKKNRF